MARNKLAARKRNRDESTNAENLDNSEPKKVKLSKSEKFGEMILADDIESLRNSKNIANFSGMKNLIRIAVDNGKPDILDFLHNTPAGQQSYGVMALAQRAVQYDQPSILQWAFDVKGLTTLLAVRQLNQFWRSATKCGATKILQFATDRGYSISSQESPETYGVRRLALQAVKVNQPDVLQWALDTKGLTFTEQDYNQLWNVAAKNNSDKIMEFVTARGYKPPEAPEASAASPVKEADKVVPDGDISECETVYKEPEEGAWDGLVKND